MKTYIKVEIKTEADLPKEKIPQQVNPVNPQGEVQAVEYVRSFGQYSQDRCPNLS